MRRTKAVLPLLLLLAACDDGVMTPPNPWTLPAGEVNFASFMVDYDTLTFFVFDLAFYPPCPDCDPDELPIYRVYEPPIDFGSIALRHDSTDALLFHATIIWNGIGDILHPIDLVHSDELRKDFPAVPYPSDAVYYGPYAIPFDDAYLDQSRAAWARISSTDLVNAFAAHDMRVAFYLYPPAVGPVSLPHAVWMIFLYWDGD